MYKILIFLFLVLNINCYSKDVTVGYFTVSPHIIKPEIKGGKPSGILVKFIEEEMAKKLGYNIIWKGPYSIKRLASEIEKGSFQMVALIGKTDTFQIPQLHYSDKYLYKGKLNIVINKKYKISNVTKSSDLNGLKIGIYDSLPNYDQEILRNKNIKLIKVGGPGWFERSFRMMELGRQDAVLMPERYPLLYMLHKKKLSHKYNIVELPSDTFYLHFAFSTKNKSSKIKDEFNSLYNNLGTTYVDYFFKVLNNNPNNFL